jgi:uncharacterized RDD family membrane protein YckC
MLPENRSFFIRGDDGEEYGPVDLAELRDWVRENRAGIGTEVRRDQPDGTWNSWQTYPELIALLAEVAVTTAVPGAPGLALAPFGRRVLAFGLDMILISVPLMIICLTLALAFAPDLYVQAFMQSSEHPFQPMELPDDANLIADLIYDTLLALYFAGFLAAHGQTPGKAVFRLRVVDQAGQKPGVGKCLVRALILVLSTGFLFIPIAYAFFNPQRRALHDYIAGTYVVEA